MMIHEAVKVTPEQKKKIDEIMKEARFKNRAEVLRHLINLGIDQYQRIKS